jgi:hypothetical protein
MSSQIINISQYNPTSDISYAKPKINANGGKNVGIINNKTKKVTMLSTPLILTWGMNEFVDDKSNNNKYHLSLQFPNSEYPDAECEEFLNKMRDFENKIKHYAIANSKEWFNKPKMSAEVVDALWNPMLTYPKNKETGEFDYSRAPTLKVKIPFWENEWKFELYDMDKNQLWPSSTVYSPLPLIPKLTRIACVLQCGGIWFAAGKFGVTWKLFQAVIKPPQSLKGKCHIQVNDNEKEQTQQPEQQVSNYKVDNDEVNVHVEDSEDDAVESTNSVEQTLSSATETSTTEDVEQEQVSVDDGDSKRQRRPVVRRKKGE